MLSWSWNYILQPTITKYDESRLLSRNSQDNTPGHSEKSRAKKQTLPWTSDNTKHWMLWASLQVRLFRYHMQNYFGPPQSPIIGAETSGPVARKVLGFVERLIYVCTVCGSSIFWTVCWEAEQNKHVNTRRTISVNADRSSIRRTLLRILRQNLNEPHNKIKWLRI
jgi:hypothetical protein